MGSKWHHFYAEYKGRVYEVETDLKLEDIPNAHAVLCKGVDVLTGKELLLKGHSWRPLTEMEVLAHVRNMD